MLCNLFAFPLNKLPPHIYVEAYIAYMCTQTRYPGRYATMWMEYSLNYHRLISPRQHTLSRKWDRDEFRATGMSPEVTSGWHFRFRRSVFATSPSQFPIKTSPDMQIAGTFDCFGRRGQEVSSTMVWLFHVRRSPYHSLTYILTFSGGHAIKLRSQVFATLPLWA